MRRLLFIGLGLCALGALWRAEEKEDGMAIALSPFLAALAIETGIFMLHRHQSLLMATRHMLGFWRRSSHLDRLQLSNA